MATKRKDSHAMELSRAVRTLNSNLSDDKEREMFYFMQIFHPERSERSNRELAKASRKENR